MTNARRALAIAVCLAVAALPAWAKNATPRGNNKNLVELTVTGGGVTEDDAIRDAMRKAIETGAGTFISSQSQTKDFALVRDTILARAAGFVQSRKILSRKELPDGTWEVKISAVVSVRGIEDTWGAVTTLLKQVGRPKIMVLIREKIAGKDQDDSTVQTRIENILLKSGFLLVAKSQLKAIDRRDLVAAVADDNPAKVQAIAKRFGAQIFITGVANCTAGPITSVGGVRLYPYQSEANVRTFRSDTAQLLSSVPGRPTRGVDRVWRSAASKALDTQARVLAPRVLADILTFWQEALAGRGEVQLQVEGLSFTQYMALKKKLKTIKEIKDIKAKYSNKIAECSLESDVNAETLAEKIAETVENLEITDVSQNVIKAKFER